MDSRFIQEGDTNVYTGCELLVKGALESEINLITGYPGSPLAEVFDIIRRNAELFKEHGIVAQIANNEALSVARLNGCQMANLRAVTFMKSLGFQVASDALAISNLAGDNGRRGCRCRRRCVVREYTSACGFAIFGTPCPHPYSGARHLPRGKGLVGGPRLKSLSSPTFTRPTLSRSTMRMAVRMSNCAPTAILRSHRKINSFWIPSGLMCQTALFCPQIRHELKLKRWKNGFPAAIQAAREQNLNQIYNATATTHEFGFVTSGLSYVYLEHALHELGMQGQIPILKFGLTHPIDEEILHEFTEQVIEIYVIEEKRPLLENDIKAILTRWYQNNHKERFVQVWGKQFPESLEGIPGKLGLNPSILIDRLIPLFRHKFAAAPMPDEALLLREEKRLKAVDSHHVDIPARTPTFCPGCPHRDSASVFMEITKHFMDAAYMETAPRIAPHRPSLPWRHRLLFDVKV